LIAAITFLYHHATKRASTAQQMSYATYFVCFNEFCIPVERCLPRFSSCSQDSTTPIFIVATSAFAGSYRSQQIVAWTSQLVRDWRPEQFNADSEVVWKESSYKHKERRRPPLFSSNEDPPLMRRLNIMIHLMTTLNTRQY